MSDWPPQETEPLTSYVAKLEDQIERLTAALELARTCILAAQPWLTRCGEAAIWDGNAKALKQIDRVLEQKP